eukprot:2534319-Amphidinium_carterae.1
MKQTEPGTSEGMARVGRRIEQISAAAAERSDPMSAFFNIFSDEETETGGPAEPSGASAAASGGGWSQLRQ